MVSKRNINFVGGETLLRKDLEILVRRAASYILRFHLIPMGTWLRENVQKFSTGRSKYCICEYGWNRKNNSRPFKCRGCLESSSGIVLFGENNHIQPIVACILHAKNADEMMPLLHCVKQEGINPDSTPISFLGDVEYDPNWWRKSLFYHSKNRKRNVSSL